MERRKVNIQNYGNSWLKPPGVPKTLYQQREEKREMEEHQEALRREALAQELAEAEAEGANGLLQGEGMDGDMEEARDLDDDVPDADNTGVDGMEDSDDEVENDTEGNRALNHVVNNAGDDIDESYDRHEADILPQQSGRSPSMLVASAREAMARLPARVPDDAYREALARGEDAGAVGFGEDGGSLLEDEDPSQILQEEDLVHNEASGMDELDMDADLDADIPDADEPDGYEHTDTEEELSSSEDDESVDAGRLTQSRTHATSMIRSDGTQTSMDISSIISNGSSQLGSSPHHRSSLRGQRSL